MRVSSKNVIRRKFPFVYELSPNTLEKSTQWLTLWLKNIGDGSLHALDLTMHSADSHQISFRNPSGYINRLQPEEEIFSNFQVDAHVTTALYFSIRYFKEGGSFHLDSPWIRNKVLGEVAELEGILGQIPTAL